jgi:N-acyl-D-aspartate/D-glutamate deacylase
MLSAAIRGLGRVDGYRATLAPGVPVFENGEETGARPGRLVRAGRQFPAPRTIERW